MEVCDSTERPKIGCIQHSGYGKNYQKLRHAMLHKSRRGCHFNVPIFMTMHLLIFKKYK